MHPIWGIHPFVSCPTPLLPIHGHTLTGCCSNQLGSSPIASSYKVGFQGRQCVYKQTGKANTASCHAFTNLCRNDTQQSKEEKIDQLSYSKDEWTTLWSGQLKCARSSLCSHHSWHVLRSNPPQLPPWVSDFIPLWNMKGGESWHNRECLLILPAWIFCMQILTDWLWLRALALNFASAVFIFKFYTFLRMAKFPKQEKTSSKINLACQADKFRTQH